jgi:hypothetical protein
MVGRNNRTGVDYGKFSIAFHISRVPLILPATLVFAGFHGNNGECA